MQKIGTGFCHVSEIFSTVSGRQSVLIQPAWLVKIKSSFKLRIERGSRGHHCQRWEQLLVLLPPLMYCIQSFTSSIITFTTLSTAMMITSHAVASSPQFVLAIFSSFQQSLLQQAKHCRGQIRKLFDGLTGMGE